MKKARIINAATWTAIATTLSVMVCLEWNANGCDAWSLIAAIAFYASASAALAMTIDDKIK